MKFTFGLTTLLFLLVQVGFAQSGTQVSIPTKANSTQPIATKSGATGDIAKGEAVTATEGKKGLNAVNVKRSKQSEVKANTKTAVLPESSSTGNIPESKHAINTKGTGATRDK